MSEERLQYLSDQLASGFITDAEVAEIEKLLEEYIINKDPDHSLTAETQREILNAIFQAGKKPAKVISVWKKISAVAAIVILLVAGYYWYKVPGTKYREKEIVKVEDVPAPVTTKATITLANGKIIVPKIENGKVEDRLWAVGSGQYEVLNNPRGSKIVMIELSDGTRVWLNSESSLKYPVEFNRRERRVTVSGEAYFEVVHNNSRFIVESNGVETEVLGTHFNINSYDNPIITLLEGSVKVSSATSAVKLNPGEQAVNGEIKQVDVQQVIAWQRGMFEFDDYTLEEISKQLTRWYDIDVRFENESLKKEKFGGNISRYLSLSSVMNMLETSGVHYKIEGKTLIIN